MFDDQGFFGIFDSILDKVSEASIINAKVHELHRRGFGPDVSYLEELRNERAYRDFRHALGDSFQPDTRMEKDFFGNRQFSISDFDGTRTIVTPKLFPDSDSCSDNDAREENQDEQYSLTLASGDNLRAAMIDFDGTSVRDIGFIGCGIQIEDDLTEKAYAPSESAEVCSISTLEVEQNDDIGDTESMNAELGYDASPGTLHFFTQAGVHITTRELQDDFVAAQSTNLAGGALDIDYAAEAEKDQMNVDFFLDETTFSSRNLLATNVDSTSAASSPQTDSTSFDLEQQYLIPAVVDDLADPDYYLGPGAPLLHDDSIFERLANARRAGGHPVTSVVGGQPPRLAEETPRTGEDEDLRREAHRECAAAQLEGVPVGYYRHFAGHMTVEEYVEAKMCVCWAQCPCSKLCTRSGDLACPCAGNFVAGEDA